MTSITEIMKSMFYIFTKRNFPKNSARPLQIDKQRVNTIIKLAGENKKVLDLGCYEGSISKIIQS
jgi:hypothetical protein